MDPTLWRSGSSLPFLIALVLLFALEAFTPGVSPLITTIHIVVLAGGAYAIARDRRLLIWSVMLLVPAVIARAAFALAPTRGSLLITHLFATLFLTTVAMAVFRRAVVQPGRVTQDRLAGAVCVYLLLGLCSTGMAAMIELLVPGSFAFPESLLDPGSPFLRATHSTYLYFSFVTLATLGYGDITPVSPAARTFSWMVAVAGQLYVAIVIARLTSLGFSDSPTPSAMRGAKPS